MIVCENTECVYPFGHEEPEDIFIKLDNTQLEKELEYIRSHLDTTLLEEELVNLRRTLDNEVVSEESSSVTQQMAIRSNSSTCSLGSSASWNTTDLDNKAIIEPSNDIAAVCNEVRQNKNNKYTKLRQSKIDKAKQEELQRMLKNIKTGHNVPDKQRSLRNEKLLRKLMQLENMSGVKLLRPEEMAILKNKDKSAGLNDLKINIDTNANSIPSIRVEVDGVIK